MHLCVALKAVIWLVYTSMWPQIWLLWTSVHVPHMRCTLARQFAVTCSCEWAVLAACMQVFCFAVWVASFSCFGFGILGWWRPSLLPQNKLLHWIDWLTALTMALPWRQLHLLLERYTIALPAALCPVCFFSYCMLFAYCLPVRLNSILLVCNGPLHLYSYVYIVHMLVSTCACMSTAVA